MSEAIRASQEGIRGSGPASGSRFRRWLAQRVVTPPATGPAAEVSTHLETVLEIAERLASTHDRTQLLRMIVGETKRALRVDVATLRLLEGDQLPVAAWAGLDPDGAGGLPVLHRTEGWVGDVIRTGRPLAIEDAGSAAGRDRSITGPALAGHLVAPLVGHGTVIGVLSAGTNRARSWTERDITFITTVATHASIALRNARLFEETETRAAHLAVLQAASSRMSRANTVEQVGRAIVEETRGIIDYHDARVYLVEPPDNVVPIASEGSAGAYEQVDFGLLRCRLGEGFTGWVALHGEPALIHDANADPRGASIAGTDDVDESMLVVPMRYDGTTIGVITLSKLGLGQFGPDDLRVLSILADQAATALESTRLVTRSQALAGELRRLLDMSSELSQSLDSRQVANLIARHVARALDVDECAISYWDKPAGQLAVARLLPGARPRRPRADVRRPGLPGDRACARAPGGGDRRR